MWSFKEGAENLPEKDVESFRTLMQEKYGETLSSADARLRYCELMSLFWLLAHKPPAPGEPAYEPPAPPWQRRGDRFMGGL